MIFDGIVIGGGPAGLYAAIHASRQGSRVLLLERNDRLGKKLLITGKGRCNVTNHCDEREVLQNIPRNGRFLYSAMENFPPSAIMDFLENYVKEVLEVVGYEVPLAVDHFGHICVEDCIRFAKRMEPYNLAWIEDMVPWMYTDQYVRLRNSTTIPVCTGEDIYLKEGFETLMKAGGVSVIHPDILTCGGALELKKIGDLADEYGIATAIHMAESPVACLAAVHTAAAMHNVLALEFHSVDVPWWADMVTGIPNPLFENGFIKVPEKPGLGFDDLNEEVLRQHINPNIPGYFEPTEEWNREFSNDRIWS